MGKYIKHTWVEGEAITDDKLNNIETGIVEAKKEAEQGAIAKQTAEKAESVAEEAKAAADSKAPAPIISPTDIVAGTTALATGQSYHVYE